MDEEIRAHDEAERIHHENYTSRAQARQRIFEYIELFYNRRRRHSALNYKAALVYERQMK